MTILVRRRTAGPAGNLRWAMDIAWTDRRNRGRLVCMAVGVGLCLTVLLTVVTLPFAFASVQDRRAAAAPAWQDSAATPDSADTFRWTNSSIELGPGEVVEGYWLDGPAGAALPPGIDSFPAPGELWVSPALDDLLQTDSAAALVVPGAVVGRIDPDTLPNPHDLSFYGGRELPADENADESAVGVSQGWGNAGRTDVQFDPWIMTILVTGTVTLLIPLLLVVALASRFGAARRDRRSALLRLLGARVSHLQSLVVVETALAVLAGLLLGSGLFWIVRAVSPLVKLRAFGLQSADMTPPLPAAVAVVVVVAGLAVAVALIGSRQAAVSPLGVLNRSRRRPRVLWRLALVAVTAVQLIVLPDRNFLGALNNLRAPVVTIQMATLVAMSLFSIAALTGLVSDLGARVLRPRAPAAQLAARRITADGAVTTRAAAAAATILAGALILVGVFQTSGDRPVRSQVTVQGGDEIVRLEADLLRILGPQLLDYRPWIDVWLVGTDAPTVRVETCSTITLNFPGASCQDGDVFADTTGTRVLAAAPYVMHSAHSSGSRASWFPTEVENLPRSTTGAEGTADFWLTPGAVSDVIPDALATVPTSVFFTADENARAALVEQTSWLGPRSAQLLANYQSVSFSDDVLPWLKTGVLLAGGLTLLIAGFAQILTANEQLTERRRAYALARATGVPLSTLRRSVVLGAVWPALVGSVVAVFVAGAVADALQQARQREPVPFDLTWTLGGVAVLILSALVVALISAARLDKLTGPDALRTE